MCTHSVLGMYGRDYLDWQWSDIHMRLCRVLDRLSCCCTCRMRDYTRKVLLGRLAWLSTSIDSTLRKRKLRGAARSKTPSRLHVLSLLFLQVPAASLTNYAPVHNPLDHIYWSGGHPQT